MNDDSNGAPHRTPPRWATTLLGVALVATAVLLSLQHVAVVFDVVLLLVGVGLIVSGTVDVPQWTRLTSLWSRVVALVDDPDLDPPGPASAPPATAREPVGKPDPQEVAFREDLAKLVQRLATDHGWTFYGPKEGSPTRGSFFIMVVRRGGCRLAIEPLFFRRGEPATEPDLAELDARVRRHASANRCLVVTNRTPEGVDVRTYDHRAGPTTAPATLWRFWVQGNEKSERAFAAAVTELINAGEIAEGRIA